MADTTTVKVKSNRRKVRKLVTDLTDAKLGNAMDDAKKLAASMMNKDFKNPTGEMRDSLKVNKKKEMQYTLEADPKNTKGKGYGAKQEWGFHDRGGTWVKGKHILQRASFGMIRRHEQGRKWEDELPIPAELKVTAGDL